MNTIHTNLYSHEAYYLLDTVMDAIRHYPGRFHTKFDGMQLQVEPNGEVVFAKRPDERIWACRRSLCNSMKSEFEALVWFARTMKMVARSRNNNDQWKRDNTYFVPAFGDETITYQKIYLVYDLLIGRKRIEQHYPAELIKEIKGEEKDALATELEMAKREEKKRIEEKYRVILENSNPDSYHGDAYRDITNRVAAFRKTIEDEWRVKYEAAKAEKKAALEQLEQSMNFMTAADFPVV